MIFLALHYQLEITGTCGMANAHADQFTKVCGCNIVACCDVNKARAKEFAGKYGIPRAFTSVEDLLANGSVDAVVNVTPRFAARSDYHAGA